MLPTRITLGLGALLVGGVAFAAILPVFPVQEPVQATQEHRQVLKGVGEWEGVLSMAIPGMDAPMEMPCSETVTAIGDLWTMGRFEGNFGGMEFVGISTLGYDTKKKMYVGTWIDNTSPVMSIMEGQWDEKKNAIVLHYDMYDPSIDAVRKMRNETVHTDGKYSITFYELTDDGESQMMKISMKKKAAAEAGR